MTAKEKEICDQSLLYFKKVQKPNDNPLEVCGHFIAGAKWASKTFIEKACQWITEHIDIPYEGEFIDNSPVASDYIEWCEKRLEYAKTIADAFKQAMEE